MKCDEQLEKWVAGNSVHNDDRDECCPDVSCCQPDLLAEESIRRKFQEAKEPIRTEMLMMFLGKLLEDKNVHIAGGPYEQGA